jgi:AraC-like DNA-binding protein
VLERDWRQGQALQVGELRMVEVGAASGAALGAPSEVLGTEAVAGHGDGFADCVEGFGARDGRFLLALQLEGTSLHRQDERDARLSAGDFTLCVSTRGYQVELSAGSRYLEVSIPGHLMRRHLACPDDVVAVRMSGSRGLTGVLSSFIRSFWGCRDDAIEAAVALRMSYTLLDLIAAAYSVTPHARHEQSSLVTAHRIRILEYIEAHLRDPLLGPTTVARACKITPRYLHHLFSSESETVTQYVQRRRLEECARALIAAPVRGGLVTEIAFDYGFNSLTHFGRVFRNQFGQTPSEYRRAARPDVAAN